MSTKSKIISGIVILLIVAGSFYGGMFYGKSQASLLAATARANFASRGNRTGASGANFISGNIISKDSNSITLNLNSTAGSKIIFYSDATQINKMVTGTSDDLSAGTSISVTGTTNSDGSLTAQSIQIRPAKLSGQTPPAQ